MGRQHLTKDEFIDIGGKIPQTYGVHYQDKVGFVKVVENERLKRFELLKVKGKVNGKGLFEVLAHTPSATDEQARILFFERILNNLAARR